MADEALSQFQAITGADLSKAQQYLQISDNNLERAIELFFETGGVDLLNDNPTSTTTAPATVSRSGGGNAEVIEINSDDEEDTAAAGASRSTGPTHSSEDDEAMARRLQEELYGGSGGGTGGAATGGLDAEGYRAPIARTTETLVGGPGSYDYDMNDPDDRHEAVLQQLRRREQARVASSRRGQAGIFNQQQAGGSIWNDDHADNEQRHTALAHATGGASRSSNKAGQLAEMFRPPFEIMARVDFDEARSQGKENLKWLLVNIQDTSIFDCQLLNRDLWKDAGIKDTIKENFIFLQYNKDDPAGEHYMQYYFKERDIQDAYPHIAIVDPRTGEQVKVWSGPPAPKAPEFLMQLHEFLDRYSLDVSAKNPVARRKPTEKKETRVERMTEDEQLQWALKNSVAGGTEDEAGTGSDPDDLTRSITDLNGKSKEKGREDADMTDAGDAEPSKFASISASSPHKEPAASPDSTRIQFRHSGGRIIRRFLISDSVSRIYEWLKSDPPDGKQGQDFELISMSKNLIDSLDQTIEAAGLKNGTVMIEFLED